jgi:hypothetical protein
MPAYPGPGLAQLLRVNRQGFLWNVETVPVGSYPGSLSQALQLERLDNAAYPWGASFEITFAANPTGFSINILGANTDAPQNYITLGTVTQASPTGQTGTGGFIWRYDMATNLWPKYVAAFMTSLTNAVNVTLTVTR